MSDLDIVDDVFNSYYFTQELPKNKMEQVEFHQNQKHEEYDVNEKGIKEKDRKKSKLTSRNTVSKHSVIPSTSYVIRNEPGKAHHIIKICVYDLSINESPCVDVQYQVKDNYDEIMSETDYLVNKIVKKISSTS